MFVFIPRSLCALKRVAAKTEHARFGATTGIRFEVKDGVLRVEATDGRRLIVVQALEPDKPEWPGLKEEPDGQFQALVLPADLEKACKASDGSYPSRWAGANLLGLATVGDTVHIGAGLNSIVTRQVEGRFPQVDKVLDQKQLQKPLFSFRIDPKLFAETLLAVNDLLPSEANGVDIFFYPGERPKGNKVLNTVIQPLIGFCAKNAESDPPLLIEGVIVPIAKDCPKPKPEAEVEEPEEQESVDGEPPAEVGSAKEAPKDFPVSWSPPTTEQYRQAKERHPEMLLLFRVGDFYELFEADADLAAKVLGLTVTTTKDGCPMAGFPHHQLETYLRKLLAEGHRVAICEPGGAEVEQAAPELPATEEKPKRRRGKKLAVVSASEEAVG